MIGFADHGLAHPGPRRGAGVRRPAPLIALRSSCQKIGVVTRGGARPWACPRRSAIARRGRSRWTRLIGSWPRVPASAASPLRSADLSACGVGSFACWRTMADAEYGKAAEFRAGLGERQLAFAVGIPPPQKVYPADVTLAYPARKATGRPRKHPVPSAASTGAAELLEARPGAFRAVSWRTGTMIGSADHPLLKGRGPAGPRGGAASGQVRRPSGAGGRRAGRGASAAPARRGLGAPLPTGSSASTAPAVNASTTCPTSPPTPRSRPWPRRSRPALGRLLPTAPLETD